MSAVKNTVGIELDCTPFTESNYRIVYLHMIESLGGAIASGEISLWHDNSDKAVKLVTSQNTGTIKIRDTKDGGIEYEIPFYIKKREFYKTTLKLSFVCLSDIAFTDNVISTEYDDITDAINTLYPGKKDIRTKTDISNDLTIFQMCETNYDLCTRLAYSFRHETIFGYSWEGFILKELCGESSSRGIKEVIGDTNSNVPKLSALALMNFTSKYNLTYDTDLLYNPINAWEDTDNSTTKTDYTDYEFLNCRAITDFRDYHLCGTDYYQLTENYRYNKNLMDAGLYTTMVITGTDFPGYKLGDVIEFRSPEQQVKYPFNFYVIASNEIFYATEVSDRVGPYGNTFEWTSKMYGLNTGEWAEKQEAQ